MAKLQWDVVGERLYETGVDKAVLYLYNTSKKEYDKAVAWSGVTSVSESPSGGETTTLWADNTKYLNMISAEEFGFSLEAYMYPDEFAECDGSAEVAPGMSAGQQSRNTFGFSYRTKIGSDTEGDAKGYKLHIIYGCVASPSQKQYSTVNDSPEAISFSWEVKTTPVTVGTINGKEYKATSTIVIDSTKFTTEDAKAKLAALEDVLYGTTDKEASLPTPGEIYAILTGTQAQG